MSLQLPLNSGGAPTIKDPAMMNLQVLPQGIRRLMYILRLWSGSKARGLGFRVWGLGLGAWGLGFGGARQASCALMSLHRGSVAENLVEYLACRENAVRTVLM